MNDSLGVKQHQIGVITDSDVTLIQQAVTLRRIPTQQFGHVVVGHTAFAALAEDTGEQILCAAKSGLGQPDIMRIGLDQSLTRPNSRHGR